MLGTDVEFSGKNEEEIGEAVDVGEHTGVECRFGMEQQDFAFCTTADGAADMGEGCTARSARKDEGAEAWQVFVNGVDGLLQAGDHVGRDGAGGRKVGASGVGRKV